MTVKENPETNVIASTNISKPKHFCQSLVNILTINTVFKRIFLTRKLTVYDIKIRNNDFAPIKKQIKNI